MIDLFSLITPRSTIVFILVLSRMSGLFLTAPLFSTYPMPAQIKAGMIATISFLLYPIIMAEHSFILPDNLLTLTLMVSKEILVGLVIGFCANIIFIGIRIGGFLLSMQTGLAMANVLDPVSREMAPALGQFYTIMISLAFLYSHAHHWLFTTIAKSYTAIPIGVQLFFSPEATGAIIALTSQIFKIGFGVVMPIFAVLLMIDILLGFVAKMMPQMNIFMVAIPFKVFVGFNLLIMFSIPTMMYLQRLLATMLKQISVIFI